jgi:hypothetical protein
MNELDFRDYRLIIFLCLERKSIIGLEEAEKEGTTDLYRKVCALMRDYNDE